MRIVADENVRFLEEAFGDWGALDVYPAGKIGPEEVRDADILIVRSVTRVDEPLLEGGAVRHVASPTSGVDHVDIDYLADRGISFHHARGSNAYAVAQYVMSVLFAMESTGHLQISGSRIAVIGCGEVGSRVAKLAAVAGLEVLAIDPPRAERDSEFETQSYDALSQADIVTFHVPLTETGPHATRHLADESFFDGLTDGCVLLNTSRGGVVDEAALRTAIASGKIAACALDVWENEPEIDQNTFFASTIVTPHIAGYTVEAKLNGTAMIYEGLCAELNKDKVWNYRETPLPGETPRFVKPRSLADTVLAAYDVRTVDAAMRDAYAQADSSSIGEIFHELRRKSRARREFSAYSIDSGSLSPQLSVQLAEFGFDVLSPEARKV